RERRGHPSMSGIPSDQVLAILRLKQWAVDRAALKTARAVNIQHTGWRELIIRPKPLPTLRASRLA
ncbi:MAG TPA: hypothetical protein VGI45_34950, partial [Terracidiphilus sp.]